MIRWLNGYGNAGLLRPNDTWEWFLRVSKYPPSLTFTLLGRVCDRFGTDDGLGATLW